MLNDVPMIIRHRYDADPAAHHVLFVSDPLIAGKQNREAILLRGRKKLSVGDFCPTHLIGKLYIACLQEPGQPCWNVMVEKNALQAAGDAV